MKNIEIHDQHIEVVFNDPTTVKVDYWAIKHLWFETEGETFSFDPNRKCLMQAHKVKDFTLTVDLDEVKCFSHTPRHVDGDVTVWEDGCDAISELRTRSDIAYVVINGESYVMPWIEKEVQTKLGIPDKYNELQRHSFKTKKEHALLTIEVGKPNE